MRNQTGVPLTLEEHRELGCELRRTRARLRELGNLIVESYGFDARAALSFGKAAEAMERLCADLQFQAARDLPGQAAGDIYT